MSVSILIAILVFGLIVVIHELGHFIMARKFGVLVEEFAIGMGPILYSRQMGETLYSLRLFPVGGFCRMLGEDNASGDIRALNNKTLGQRAIILSFGAVMNIFLAFIIFLFLVSVVGFTTAEIKGVVPDTPIDKAGLTVGDRIINLNGTVINIFEDLSLELSLCNGQTMSMTYIRNNQQYKTNITPYEAAPGIYKLGFYPEGRTGVFAEEVEGFERASILESLSVPVYQIMFFIRATIVSIIKLITLQIPVDAIYGPIGIVTVIDQAYTESIQESGWYAFLNMINLCAFLSANLGVFNLLPVPALDGGRLIFVLFELIRRKPVPVEKEGLVHFIGFVLLMIFAVFIAYSDIMKLLS